MRRIIASVTLVLGALAACAAQELNLNLVTRFDGNKSWPLKSTSSGNNRINWGNSSLYVLADGSFTGKLSYDIAMNFLNSDPVSLYSNTGSCVETNWLNWADFTYSFNDNWSVSAGKQIMLLGGWEIDMYDFDQLTDLCSQDWQLINVYQWGGKVAYSPSEEHLFAVQVSSSPLRDLLLEGNEIAASFQTRNTVGIWESIFSANYIQTPYDECPAMYMATFGNQIVTDRICAFIDYTLKTPGNQDFGALRSSVTASLACSFCDGCLEVGAKGGYDTTSDLCPDIFGYSDEWETEEDGLSGIVPLGLSPMRDYCFGGLFVNGYPLEGLRVHAAVGCNNYTKSPSVTLGVCYQFGAKIL